MRLTRTGIYPVFFENESDDWKYSGAGTCFLARLDIGIYAITARHVIQERPAAEIVLLPTHAQVDPIRFSRIISITNNKQVSEKQEEIVLLQVSQDSVSNIVQFNTPIMDFHNIPNDWADDPETYSYVVYGYPQLSREIDWETKSYEATQHQLTLSFEKDSPIDGCDVLKIESNTGPEEIDGHSGSPVFAWPKGESDVFSASICGVAVLANIYTNRVHFLRRSIIEFAVNQIKAS